MNSITEYWPKLNKFIKINPVTNFLSKFMINHHEKIVPTLFIVILGGSVLFIWGNGISKRKLLTTTKTEKEYNSQFAFTDLPSEIRRIVLTKLEYPELLRLRLVSEVIKGDVDHSIGLKISIGNSGSEKFEFAQAVALQSCIISDLNNLGPNFLSKPHLMKELELRERSVISPLNNWINILFPCINLTKLNVRCIHSSNISEISEVIIDAIQNMKNLQHLQIFKIGTNLTIEKDLSAFREPISKSFPLNLTHVELEIADVSAEQAAAWKYILQQQIHIQFLFVHFAAVPWEYFKEIFQKNKNLEQIGFVCGKSYRRGSQEEIPFDWSIFENCNNLRWFSLTCEKTLNMADEENMHSINFQSFPCENIEEFYVYRTVMSPQDVYRVYHEMLHLRNGSMFHVGDEGAEMAAQLAWLHNRHQELERSNWLSEDRVWDVIAHFLIGVALIGFVISSTRNHHNSTIVSSKKLETHK